MLNTTRSRTRLFVSLRRQAPALVASVLAIAWLGATSAAAQTIVNEYDAAGRLVLSSDGTTVVGYRYDPAGNILSRTVPEPDGLWWAIGGLVLLVARTRRFAARRSSAAGPFIALGPFVALGPLVVLALLAALAAPSPANAHICDGQFTEFGAASNPMELTLGRIKRYVIKADVSESQESGYTLVINSNPAVALVTPPPGESAFKRGVYTVRGESVGTATILLNWTYAPNGAQGNCTFDVVVSDPAEDRRNSAAHDQSKKTGDPVNEWTGGLVMDLPPDLYIDSILPMSVSRYYGSDLAADGQTVTTLGRNWLHNYEMLLSHVGNRIDVAFARGRGLTFDLVTGSWVLREPLDIPFQLIEDGGDYVLMNPQDWMRYRFDSAGRLVEIMDRNGNALTLGYDQTNLTSVTDPFGKGFTYTYGFFQELLSVSDGTRTVDFDQFFSGNLLSVTDARMNTTTYTYDPGPRPGLLTGETTARATQPFSQTYDSQGRVVTQTDSEANDWTLAYSGTQTTVTNPLLDVETAAHDDAGTLASVTDFAGEAFGSTYDAAGRRTGFTDREGDPTTATYHAASGRMTSHTDALGQTTRFDWTAQNQDGFTFYNLTRYELPDGSDYHFTHDATGNVLTIQDPNDDVTTYTYNGRGQPLTRVQPLLGTTTYTYHATSGMLATVQSPDTFTTSLAYDALNRPIRVDNPDLSFRTFTYDAQDNLLTFTDEESRTTTYTYDENGNRTSVLDPDGVLSTFSWDGNDRLMSASDPLGMTMYSYDALGRLATVSHSNGESATITWDEAGFPVGLTDAMGMTTHFAYDREGVPTGIIDPLSRSWTLESDTLGDLTRVSNTLSGATHYDYDDRGRLERISSPEDRTLSFGYDAAGSLSSIAMPLGVEVQYTRDEEGQLSSVVDPNGESWTRQYDSQGQLESTSDPLGRTTTYGYDDRGRRDSATFPAGSLSLTYDDVGNVLQRSHSGGPTISYSYDELDRVMTADGVSLDYDAAGNVSHSNGQDMTYDGAGRLLSIEFAPGETVQYSYNDCGLVEQVTDYTGGVTTFTYNAATELTHLARPNGVTTIYDYDDAGRLSRIRNMDGPTMISDIDLLLDQEGNVIRSTRMVPTAAPLGSATNASFSYDAASQLSIAGASYDANGRRTSEPGRTYTWDGANLLQSDTDGGVTTAIEYDAFGNRTSWTRAGMSYGYTINYATPGGSITEIASGGSPMMRYVPLPNGRLLHGIDVATNDKIFYHFDESGSTSFLTNDAGTITDSYGLTPYGEAWNATGSTFNPFVYQGAQGVLSEGNGLYQMGTRFYHSGSGAFLSGDVISAPTPKAVNPYSYANNNPVRFGSPRGIAPRPNAPIADIFTPTNQSFLAGSFFEGLDRFYEWKRLDQIDQAIKHSRQFPTRNPFPVISDAVKTEALKLRLGRLGNVVGFGIDAYGEGTQARKEGKGWVQSGLRAGVGGGTGLAIGVASAPVALVDGLTGENLSHSIKQVYRVPEALLGSERDRRAYTNAARSGDYGAAVQVTNRAGEIYAEKGVINTLSGIGAQGFWDSIDSLGYAWFGAPKPYELSKRALARMNKRRESARQAVEKANGMGEQRRVTRTRHR